MGQNRKGPGKPAATGGTRANPEKISTEESSLTSREKQERAKRAWFVKQHVKLVTMRLSVNEAETVNAYVMAGILTPEQADEILGDDWFPPNEKL